jgi:Fe-S-cluster containining protein
MFSPDMFESLLRIVGEDRRSDLLPLWPERRGYCVNAKLVPDGRVLCGIYETRPDVCRIPDDEQVKADTPALCALLQGMIFSVTGVPVPDSLRMYPDGRFF